MNVDSSSLNKYTPDEMMTIAAARLIWPGCVCFVGIGVPSAAANLARLTHAPDIVLIYESGAIGTQPRVLPLSIGDGELAETADAVVPLPEIFSYWLQAGRIDVGFPELRSALEERANVRFLARRRSIALGISIPLSLAATESQRRGCRVLVVRRKLPTTPNKFLSC